ncbi:MAG: type II toxin-antitoxin system prevent-host-death family antitoxin [Vulcanimicrobiota bacterium]
MKSVTTHQAKTQLSQLIEQVRSGEEIVILRGRLPVARLVPYVADPAPARPQVGIRTSEPILLSPDAFAPLSDAELADWGL